VSNGEKYAKSHGIPMFGNGREDTTMKHVVLTALGSVLSFVFSVVCNPFAAWLLPMGTYLGDFRMLFPNSNIFNSATILLTPSILFAYSSFVGRMCQDDKKIRTFQVYLVMGCFAGFIYLMKSSVNKIQEMVNFASGELGSLPLIFVMGTLGVIVGILYLGLMGGVLLGNVGAIVLGSYAAYDRQHINYKGVAAVLLIFLCFCTVFTYGFFPLADVKKTTPSRNITEMIVQDWTIHSDSVNQYVYRMEHIRNGYIAEYTKETSPAEKPLRLCYKVYDKNRKLIAENYYSPQILENELPNIKNLDNQDVLMQIVRYRRKEISLKDLVAWAHCVFFDGSISEKSPNEIIYVVGRIGLVDVPEFGLSEEIIRELIARLTVGAQ
jgi:hypothetical protein